MDENSNEISNPEESDQRENHTDAASKASNEASAEHILPGDEGEPPMPDAPGDIHEVDITTAEDQEELLVDFGKVPLSKDRSEFDDSLYPVSVADPSQISDETSKLLHRLHYDPYDEDEAELRFLHSKPTCFIILGKPGSGKTDLVKKLANEWKCQMVSACTVIQEAMDMETEEGLKVQELLLRGESVPEEMAAKMIEAKINSPEVTHHGYVLDGFPSMCEDYLSINNQLELIRNWKMKPDFIINLKMPDNDLVNRRLGQKVDPMTGEIYTKEVYDPDKPEPVQKDPEDEGDEDREDEEEEAEPEVEEEPVIPVLPPEVVKRLVKRPEDMEAFLPDDIQKYKSNMLRLLEDYMADHDQQYLLELDANKPSHILLRELMLQLDTFVLRPAAVPLRLQDAEDEELPEDMDTDELLRTFAPKQMVAPRFRWRRSRWLRNCPVALADGNIVTGKPEYAVSFLDKMYVMSNDLAMAKFLKNPRPFLLPPQPRPPCKLVVLGPQLSGKTTVAHLLALRYGATVLDLDVLVIPRYQEEWERKVEKARDDAAAAAIELLKTKLAEAAEKERRRLETATSDDGNADDAEAGEGEDDEVNEDGEKEDTEGDKDTEAEGDKEVAAPVEEQDAEAEEAAVSQEAEEGKAEDQDVEQEDADEEKKKEKKEKDTTVMGVEVKGMTPDEIMAIPVTTRHPVIVRIANDAAREAVQEPFPIADELYVEVLETSIRNAEKVELLKNPDGPRYGGWVLDNFPRNKEQWILCVEKNLLPDDVVILSDPSDNGDFLIRRWYDLNKDVIDKRIEDRLAREEQDRKDKEEAERRRIEEERLAEEEAARRLREEEIEARMEAGETLSEAKGPEGVEGEEVPREEGEEEEEAEAEAEAEVEVEVEEADADKEKGDEATEGSAAMEEEEEEPEPQPPEVLDLPLPPEGEELTQQREARKTQDEDIMSCRGIITSGGGIEPIIVDICEKNDFGLWSSRVIEDMLKDVTTHIEQKYMYQAWELQGMDIDEEEEDVEAERNLEPEPENEEEEQEEEEDPNRSVKKPLGDTNHFCPVALKEHDILLPGNPEITAKHRERYYYCSSNEARDKFIADPPFYLPKGKPPKVPPPRILMLGPRGAGKSLHGRDLARKMGIFHIQFRERLQELVIAKTKKKIGAEYTEDDDEPGEKEEEEEEEEDEDEDDIGAITAPDGSKMEEGDSADSKATITSPGDVDPQSSTSGVNIPAEKEEEEEEEVTYTEDEEAIVAYLKEDDPLPNELLEKIIADWWKKEPFKSTGFILEGYPRTADEASFLGEMGLFPDVALVLVVEDGDVIGRILPPRLDKWKRKRDKKLARKQRLKEKAAKKREAAMAKRRAALVKEQEERKAERKAELLAERGEEEGDSEEEAEEEEEEEEGDDIDAILAEEFEEEEEEEDGDEETEEEAVERMKNDIEEIYDTDTNRVAAIQEKLEEMLVPRIEVDAGKKTHIVRYIINRQLGPYLNNRDSIFERVIPISEPLANKMIRRGYKQPSRFGRWCPVKLLEGDCIQPMQGPGYPTFPAIYRQFIYYLSTAEALKQFSIDPLRYLKQPSPKPVVPIRMAIVGPPKSGKTSLAKRFENEYGVVRLSIGEAIRNIIELQPKTELVKTIKSFLRRGQTIPDELAVRALEVRLMDVTCQTRGYVLDGFPLTMKHVDLMTARDIIPVKMIELIVNSLEVVNRATKDRYSPERQMALHDSGQILMVKLATWQREINTVREHYADHHANWVKVDGQKCKWWVCNEVLKIGRESIVQIQKYLERLAEGKAASIADMCITPKEFVQRLGDFDQYCPVSLALKGELVDCSGIVSLKHAAEYRGHYYKMHGPEELKKFLADPNQFVPPNAPHTLPAPELLPKRVTGAEARRMFPKPIELKGYCPVTFLDGKKRYEAIVPGNQELVILYRGQLYNMATEKKLERFMRTPQKYWNLSLPHKLPPKKDPLTVTSLPMLGYLEQTVSTAITKALTAVGNVKPKYPFMNATQSALVYVAYHLKAYNPHSPEYVRKKYKLKLMQFEEMCEIINYLGLNMSKRYKEPKERPIDFDHKMDRFLQQKRRQSTQ